HSYSRKWFVDFRKKGATWSFGKTLFSDSPISCQLFHLAETEEMGRSRAVVKGHRLAFLWTVDRV
ncbi:MAG TPA: hypothetical protein VEH09_11960, partial [Thermodesulfobacteriota bacterium]|nr:hypothetical protein [Thermodesulfobacteriota bacterium]